MPEISFWFRLNKEGILEIYDKPEEGCTERTVQLPDGEEGYKEFLGVLAVLAEEMNAESMAATHQLMDKVKSAVGMAPPPPPPKKRLLSIVGAEEGEGPPEVTAQPVMIPGHVASSIRAYAAQYPNTEIWGYLIGRGQTAERAEFLPIEYGEFDKFRLAAADEAGEVDKIKSSLTPDERILGMIHKHISPMLVLEIPPNLKEDPRYDFNLERGVPSKYDLAPSLVGPDQILVMVDPTGKLRQWRRVGIDGAEEITSMQPTALPAAPSVPRDQSEELGWLHGTEVRNLIRILRYGLKPSSPGEEGQKPILYLTTSFRTAETFAVDPTAYLSEQEIVILELARQPGDEAIIAKSTVFSEHLAFITAETLPPERITRIYVSNSFIESLTRRTERVSPETFEELTSSRGIEVISIDDSIWRSSDLVTEFFAKMHGMTVEELVQTAESIYTNWPNVWEKT